MALPAVAAAATSFAPSIFKFFAGRSQVRQANRINPVNPGFVANPAFANNERILRERSNNYVMPGYGNAMNNIVTNGATAFSNGVEGATSGADVLDLASKINYGTGQNLNELAQTNATGANDALNQYMQASVMSGNELVRKNMFDLDEYNRQLEEKAALLQAGRQNQFSAGDDIANGLRQFIQPQQKAIQPGYAGSITPQKSIFNF